MPSSRSPCTRCTCAPRRSALSDASRSALPHVSLAQTSTRGERSASVIAITPEPVPMSATRAGRSPSRASAASTSFSVVARELLGPRPAFEQPTVRYRDALRGSPFSDVVELHVFDERTWTPDALIGLAYSTSFASLARLGDRREEFERRLRARLKPRYTERVQVDALLGRRRDE